VDYHIISDFRLIVLDIADRASAGNVSCFMVCVTRYVCIRDKYYMFIIGGKVRIPIIIFSIILSLQISLCRLFCYEAPLKWSDILPCNECMSQWLYFNWNPSLKLFANAWIICFCAPLIWKYIYGMFSLNHSKTEKMRYSIDSYFNYP
jgi:hypothetical protein